MLKLKVNQDAFDALSEDVQGLYAEKDGVYMLQVDGIEDTSALKRAKLRETEKRKQFQSDLEALKAQMEENEGNDARKRGDIETLDKSWQDKYSKLESDYQSKIDSKNGFIQKALVDNVASEIAGAFESTKQKLMMLAIKPRLGVDLDGDAPKTVVFDADGKPSALTVKELKQEFIDNPDYSDMIVASKASGGGASTKSAQPTGGAFSGGEKPDLWNATPEQAVAHIKALQK